MIRKDMEKPFVKVVFINRHSKQTESVGFLKKYEYTDLSGTTGFEPFLNGEDFLGLFHHLKPSIRMLAHSN